MSNNTITSTSTNNSTTSTTSIENIYYSSIEISYCASHKNARLFEDIDTGRLFVSGYNNSTKFVFYHKEEKEIDRVEFNNDILQLLCKKHLILFLKINYDYHVKSESDINIFNIYTLSTTIKELISLENFKKNIIGKQPLMNFINNDNSRFSYLMYIEILENDDNK